MKTPQTTASTANHTEATNDHSSWTAWITLIPVLATLTALAATGGNATGFWTFAPGMIALFGGSIFLAFAEKPRNARASVAIAIAGSATVTMWAIGQLATVVG